MKKKAFTYFALLALSASIPSDSASAQQAFSGNNGSGASNSGTVLAGPVAFHLDSLQFEYNGVKYVQSSMNDIPRYASTNTPPNLSHSYCGFRQDVVAGGASNPASVSGSYPGSIGSGLHGTDPDSVRHAGYMWAKQGTAMTNFSLWDAYFQTGAPARPVKIGDKLVPVNLDLEPDRQALLDHMWGWVAAGTSMADQGLTGVPRLISIPARGPSATQPKGLDNLTSAMLLEHAALTNDRKYHMWSRHQENTPDRKFQVAPSYRYKSVADEGNTHHLQVQPGAQNAGGQSFTAPVTDSTGTVVAFVRATGCNVIGTYSEQGPATQPSRSIRIPAASALHPFATQFAETVDASTAGVVMELIITEDLGVPGSRNYKGIARQKLEQLAQEAGSTIQQAPPIVALPPEDLPPTPWGEEGDNGPTKTPSYGGKNPSGFNSSNSGNTLQHGGGSGEGGYQIGGNSGKSGYSSKGH